MDEHMNEFYNIRIHNNITKEQTWGPIDDTKPQGHSDFIHGKTNFKQGHTTQPYAFSSLQGCWIMVKPKYNSKWSSPTSVTRGSSKGVMLFAIASLSSKDHNIKYKGCDT